MFEAIYPIPYSGIGPDGRMKLPVLLDILQDMADRDAGRMGMTVSDLLPLGVSWVLRQYSLSMIRYPESGRTLTVKTWHEPHRNLYSNRAFSVEDEEGPVAEAWTSWILIDIEKMRPLRLDRYATERYISEIRPVPGDLLKIPSLGAWTSEALFSVRRWDLDRNAHVNNAVYFSWAVEGLPDSLTDSSTLRRIEGEFLRSTERNGDITARSAPLKEAEGAYSSLICGADGEEKARFLTFWLKNQ